MRALKAVLVSLLATALVFIVTLTAGEWLVRNKTGDLYYIPRMNFWRLGQFTALFRALPETGEITLFHTGVNFHEKVRIDKPEGVRRVLLIGTSSTEGYRVARKDNYASRLQRLFDEAEGSGKVEVINGAAGGYVSFQLLVYFEQILGRLSPDVVVLYLGHNDSQLHGFLTAREYYRGIAAAHARHKDSPKRLLKIAKYGLDLNPVTWLFAESRLFGLCLRRLHESVPLIERVSGRKAQKLQCPPEDQEYVLREFARLARERNFQLVFAIEALRQAGAEASYAKLMKRVALEEGAVFVDPRQALSENTGEMFLDQVHLTVKGHDRLARLLYETLDRQTATNTTSLNPDMKELEQ